jgi:putative phosphoesterase
MRIAALYDIHGNIHALEAVLAEVQEAEPDLIVVGGDVASGPFPRETVECLMQLPIPARFVMGNADREVIAEFEKGSSDDPDPYGSRWCSLQLRLHHIQFLQSFVPTVSLELEGVGPILFCHGSPRSDEELITPETSEEKIAPMLEGVDATVVVCGHTHMQFDREVNGIRVVNAGSVGMPYERATGAYWAMAGRNMELRRTTYDLMAAATAIRKSGWPPANEFADENVLTIPTPEEAIAVFEGPSG